MPEQSSGWEAERARTERLARAEVQRLEGLVALAPIGSGRGQRLAAELGVARHKLRTSLSMIQYVKYLETTNPARYLALWRENGPPDPGRAARSASD
jgi:predicted transcriptional regulator